MPVVYDPRVAPSLLGHLAGAINGAAVARGTSFLKDRLGQRVLPAGRHGAWTTRPAAAASAPAPSTARA